MMGRIAADVVGVVCRLASNRPAQAEFTFYDTKDRLQTSITLQDGCFGTATLMRIAALFMDSTSSPPPPPAQPAASTANADTAAPSLVNPAPLRDDSNTKDASASPLHAESNSDAELAKSNGDAELTNCSDDAELAEPKGHSPDCPSAGQDAQISEPLAAACGSSADKVQSVAGGAHAQGQEASRADLAQSAAVGGTDAEAHITTGLPEHPVNSSGPTTEGHELHHLTPDLPKPGTTVHTDAGGSFSEQHYVGDEQAAASGERPAAHSPQSPQASHADMPPARGADNISQSQTARMSQQAHQAGLAAAVLPSEQGLWAAVALGASNSNTDDTMARQAATSAMSAIQMLDPHSTGDSLQHDAQPSFAAAQTAADVPTGDVTSTTEGNGGAESAPSSAHASSEAAGGDSTGGVEPVESASTIKQGPTEPAPKRREQFSIEIVRCKTVCPAKVALSNYTDADSPLHHTLYMDVPHMLLQLPLEQPAQHPRPHPVSLSVRHVLNRQQPAVPAPDAIAPSPFAADQQQGTICALTNLTLYVALPEEFDSAEASHSRSAAHTHTQLPPLLSIPTASLLAVGLRPPPFNPSLKQGLLPEPVPALELEMTLAKVIAKPAQLQTMSASTIRYTTEMNTLLGKSSEPSLAATANSQAAEAVPNSPAPQLGVALTISVGLVSVELHSSRKDSPALMLQWQRLEGHYARAAPAVDSPAGGSCIAPVACGLTWHYLALQLAQNPADQKQQQFSLEHVGTLRSASLLAPSRMSR